MNLLDFLFPKWKPSTWFIFLFVNITICIEFIIILYNIYSVEEFTKYDIPKYTGRYSIGLLKEFAYPIYINYGIIGLLAFYSLIFSIVSFFMVRSFRNRKKKKDEDE